MSTPVAIVIAAVILAAALLVAFRWEIVVRPTTLPFVLDRWTGGVSYCTPSTPPTTDTSKNPFADLIPNGKGGGGFTCFMITGVPLNKRCKK